MGRSLETEEEVVETDGSMRGEAGTHGGEVYRTMVLVDLDGVAAAERDVGPTLSGEVGELAESADGAAGTWGGGVDLAAVDACVGVWGPEVEGEEGSAQEMGLAGEEFEGFCDLNGGGEVDGGGEDAGGVTGFDGAGGWLGEDAGKACGGNPGFGRGC